MVAKMMKWSPWPAATTRKFQVKVKPAKLEGLCGGEEDGGREKVMAIEMRWKGGGRGGLVSFNRTSWRHRDVSSETSVNRGQPIQWDNDEFHKVCNFSTLSKDANAFAPWDVSFRLLYGDKTGSKAKLVVIGKATLNLAELVSNLESQIERKLPITLRVEGVYSEAILLVSVCFVEVRDFRDSVRMAQNSGESGYGKGLGGERKKRHEEASPGYSGEWVVVKSGGMSGKEPVRVGGEGEFSSASDSESSSSSEARSDSARKAGVFSWKRRRLSSKTAKNKVEPLIKKTVDVDDDGNCNNGLDQPPSSSSSSEWVTSSSGTEVDAGEPCVSEHEDEASSTTHWEDKELVSRDGQTKLKASVFFASFDQCSERAAGEGACSVLVAAIAHWLQSNPHLMPTRSEFDSLIVEGSSDWRRLCDNNALIRSFPNRHFDLETVLQSHLRPLDVSSEHSFIGFFSPEQFESLKGAMSFDDIWNEINNKIEKEQNEPRIYIVSWNDHFFVLKADANAYYIIDTLGGRLFEGCKRAFILRFDDSALMKIEKEKVGSKEMAKDDTTNPKEEREEIICRGKECCREFIKRFLAAIPLKELEEEEKKETVSYYSLHQRLQIEFHFSYSLSSTSAFSPSSDTSTSSSFLNGTIFV